jgi:FkbM family methyltransferase
MKQLRYLWRAYDYRFRKNRSEIAFLRERIRPGNVVVDVGAHKGGYLYWLQRLVGATGSVYAFEPQPALARYLKDVVAARGWRNVIVEWAGVSSTHGSMELFVPAGAGATSPGATLSPTDLTVPHYSVSVPVVTLDDYFGRQGGPPVHCIKCDCEGHELRIFEGAEGLIRRDGPLLLFECESRHLGGQLPRVVFDYLRGLGYTGYFFGPAGLMPVDAFEPATHQPVRAGRYWNAPDYYNNFAFVRDA